MHTVKHPMPGDCIKLLRRFYGHNPGSLAFITGKLNEARDILVVSFADNAYRDEETTSAHGSPTYLIPAGALVAVNETAVRTCWRWKNNGRHSGHPESHLVEVDVWHLDPKVLPFEYSDAPNKARVKAEEILAKLMGMTTTA